jgi:flagellar basal-body rod modification protein FlgD
MDIFSTAFGTNNGAAQGAKSRSSLSQTYDSFLQLLTTQLQYQDPLAPTDTAQFTNQLVQFSQVEQQISLNDKLAKLTDMQIGSLMSAALGYVGLEVEVQSDTFEYKGEPMSLRYALAGDSRMTDINIIDAAGRLVRRESGERLTGAHAFTWDGKNDAGLAVNPGLYRVVVTAKDQNLDDIETSTSYRGLVTGIDNSTDGIQLLLGNRLEPVGNVLSARKSSATALAAAGQ